MDFDRFRTDYCVAAIAAKRRRLAGAFRSELYA
jgi:hypothetical protein